MDKATPTSTADVFQANRDRAGPLLAKLKAEGIGHVIDGKVIYANDFYGWDKAGAPQVAQAN